MLKESSFYKIIKKYISKCSLGIYFFDEDSIMTYNPENTQFEAYEKQKQEDEINEYILSISLMKNFSDFSIIYKGGKVVGKVSESTKKFYDGKDIYLEMISQIGNAKSKAKWFINEGEVHSKIYFVKKVNDNAVIFASIYTTEFIEIFDELKDESNTTVRLCNEDNTVVFSTNEEELGQKLSSNIAEKINNETTRNFKVDNNLILYDKCENGWSIVNRHIAELVESIKEVEKVIYIIEDINEQTNLLSLNAGIEAARAGESGKGFLVVADEVKKLAEQSKNSTSSVYEVIKNINYKASSAINLIETSKKAFEEQRDALDFTNSSFENVIKATEKIGNQLNVIYSFTKGIDEQTANAENLEKGAEKLRSTVEGLENSINRFKVEE